MIHDLVIVGAGIAGLSCARAAAAAGARPLVIERSRDVGGRCASRRLDGQPVDHGLAFFHGAHPAFLEALATVDAPVHRGWPARVRGSGAPCQPQAFHPDHERLAFEPGVKAFPRALAHGIDIRFETTLAALDVAADALVLTLAGGEQLRARDVVLTLPNEPSRAFLDALPPDQALRAVKGLLGMVGTLPSLTVAALYPAGTPVPPWEIWYPEDSRIVQLVAHDSTKRAPGARTALVIQSHARWARERLEARTDPAAWSKELLGEAARLAGDWVSAPAIVHPQRWLHARLDRGSELTRAITLDLHGGARIGLAGELFAPGGGAEAAFLAGRELGQRLTSTAEST